MATKKVKKATKKATTAKKNINIDLKDSFNKIKDTAINVNNQVMNTAGVVAEDIMENGEQVKDVTVNRIKKAYGKVSATVNMENVKGATKTINKYTLKTAEEMVDGALVNGEKWQAVAHKAVKGSLKLAAKQQDIIFDTLETVKGQLGDTAVKLKKIFSNN